MIRMLPVRQMRTAAVLVTVLVANVGVFAAIPYDGPEWPPVKPEFDPHAASHPARVTYRNAEPMPDFLRPHDVRVEDLGGPPRL